MEVREIKKANPKVKTAKGEIGRETLQPETADLLTFEMQELNQAQLSVAPKQKRLKSTAWTSEEH